MPMTPTDRMAPWALRAYPIVKMVHFLIGVHRAQKAGSVAGRSGSRKENAGMAVKNFRTGTEGRRKLKYPRSVSRELV